MIRLATVGFPPTLEAPVEHSGHVVRLFDARFDAGEDAHGGEVPLHVRHARRHGFHDAIGEVVKPISDGLGVGGSAYRSCRLQRISVCGERTKRCPAKSFHMHLRTTNPIESNLRNRAPEDHQDQGLPQPDHGAHHGLQVVPVGSQEVAGSRRISTASPRSSRASNSRTGEKLIERAA